MEVIDTCGKFQGSRSPQHAGIYNVLYAGCFGGIYHILVLAYPVNHITRTNEYQGIDALESLLQGSGIMVIALAQGNAFGGKSGGFFLVAYQAGDLAGGYVFL